MIDFFTKYPGGHVPSLIYQRGAFFDCHGAEKKVPETSQRLRIQGNLMNSTLHIGDRDGIFLLQGQSLTRIEVKYVARTQRIGGLVENEETGFPFLNNAA